MIYFNIISCFVWTLVYLILYLILFVLEFRELQTQVGVLKMLRIQDGRMISLEAQQGVKEEAQSQAHQIECMTKMQKVRMLRKRGTRNEQIQMQEMKTPEEAVTED